jgi:hypothetical protein
LPTRQIKIAHAANQPANQHKENKMNIAKMLAATATIALITGMGAAVAQQEPSRGAPAEKAAPGAKQPSTMQHQNGGASNSPAVRSEGQNSRSGEASQSRGRSETTGQAPKEGRQNETAQHNKSEQDRAKSEKNEKSERNEQNRTTGQAPREDRLNRTSQQNKSEQDRAKSEKSERTEQNRTTGQAPREDRTNRASEQNKSEQDRVKTERNEENRATTGQGAAGTRTNVNVNITPEKRTQIHETIIKERSAPRVGSVNFDLSVGTRVPRTGSVRFATLPSRIVEIEPEWRGYEYFMVGDRIVIVDPRSMEIVAVIDA